MSCWRGALCLRTASALIEGEFFFISAVPTGSKIRAFCSRRGCTRICHQTTLFLMLLFAAREQLHNQHGFRTNDVGAGSAAGLPLLPLPPACSSCPVFAYWTALMGMSECPVRSSKASEECSLLPWGLSKASSLAIGMQQETSGTITK